MTTLPRLGINIDHIATVRNARGGEHPDPVAGAYAAIRAGADGITAHLREDRRHLALIRVQAIFPSAQEKEKASPHVCHIQRKILS